MITVIVMMLPVSERNLEDHEEVYATCSTWASNSNNKFLLRRDPKKYDFFVNTEVSFEHNLLAQQKILHRGN